MSRLLIPLVLLALALTLGGCASLLPKPPLAELPLPPPTNSHNCCWQALQSLEIRHQDQTLHAQAVLARSSKGTQLVLLDTMGRRLLSADYTPEGITEYRSQELPERASASLLLKLALLAWLPKAELEAAGIPLQQSKYQRLIDGDATTEVKVTYNVQSPNTLEQSPVFYDSTQPAGSYSATIDLAAYQLSLTARTLTWELLP